jgi:hypothetical protein
MKRWALAGAICALSMAAVHGRPARAAISEDAGAGGQKSAREAAKRATGHTVAATLDKPLDADKCKAGDEITAHISQSSKGRNVALPQGTKLVARIVQAKASGQDGVSSQVTINFDRAVTPDGKELPIHASIASVSRAQAATPPSTAMPGDMGIPGDASGGANAAPRGGHGGQPAMSGTTSEAVKGSGPQNQHGISGITLQQRAGGTIISSNSKNVHLDSGTQLLLNLADTEKEKS